MSAEAELQAERDMLVARLIADANHDASLVGVSSTAMLLAALTGRREPAATPHDVYDLNRCERTYEMAPPHLQARMKPMLERHRQKIERTAAERPGWFRESFERDHKPVALGEEQSRG